MREQLWNRTKGWEEGCGGVWGGFLCLAPACSVSLPPSLGEIALEWPMRNTGTLLSEPHILRHDLNTPHNSNAQGMLAIPIGGYG